METSIITGRHITNGRSEGEYRAIPVDSSSSLKDFDLDRRKYYKKYIQGQWVEEEDSVAITIGKLTDMFLLGSEQEFDNCFYRSSIVSPITGAMALFTEALFIRTMEAVDEDGEVKREMVDIMKDAYNDVKFDKNGQIVAFKRAKVDSFEGVVERFTNSEAITYYKEIREVRPKGLIVITSSQEDAAKRVVEQLKSSPNTKHIFDPHPDEVFNQLKIDGFEIDGLPLKGMIDRTHVNHSQKIIKPLDLKCTWHVENFYENYYLKRRTYFQAYIYFKALQGRHEDLGFDYSDYTILPPTFIVADSSAFYEPLLYDLNYGDLEDAYNGFIHKNRFYKGLQETIAELKWSKETNIWNISFENYKNDGRIMLNTKKV